MGFLNRIFNRSKAPEAPTATFTRPAAASLHARSATAPWSTTPPPFGAGFAVVDVETTGLSPRYDRVIEVAILRLDTNGRTVDEWSTRLNPQRTVGATWIHGITDADVAHAPSFADVAAQVAQRLTGAVFVGHNARFDAGFVLAELTRAGWDAPEPTIWCTQAASHHWLPDASSRRLVDVAAAAGISLTHAHSALGDARATAAMLTRYIGASTGVDRLDDLAAVAAATAWPERAARTALGPVTIDVPPLSIYPRRPARARQTVPPKLRTYRLSGTALDGLTEAVRAYALDLSAGFPNVSASLRTALADKHGLDDVGVLAAHERLLATMAVQVVADGRVTATEQGDLDDFADTLGLPIDAASKAIASANEARTIRLSETVRPLPATWEHGAPLHIGDAVVFTGDFPSRAALTAKAEAAGLRVVGSVSRKTAALVTDGEFIGNKANRAAELGTRIVSPDDFTVLLRYVQHAPAPQPKPKPKPKPPAVSARRHTSAPADVAATGPQADPAAVRAWARENGLTVSQRGRLSSSVVAAYQAAHSDLDDASVAR
ncbi:DNA polymerase III, epsilon subunit [Xylanimonas cellulosilytica DSM 15894]|uniref:DNA polymerase III, epsilon subunit n=1 Tax=Xylanimonas cellulosilytica (strain DSM 15894 / JCM 12276 / CECT 5975 / KCTC 9989 / LMG 20990 / NBRC 107835 / XIL07) TaxID=446471 RepID=D1BUD4_XYLCX|nr:DNA polymerase III, epsilon subunit [Xylanimonas cellulosilytica DSM 15894]